MRKTIPIGFAAGLLCLCGTVGVARASAFAFVGPDAAPAATSVSSSTERPAGVTAGGTAVSSAGGPAVSSAGGNVTVTVAPALIAPSDGLPASLVPGVRYTLGVHVWLAGGQPQATASVTVGGVRVSTCGTKNLVAGTVETIRCGFVAPKPTSAGAGSVTVRVSVAISGTRHPIVKAFDHQLDAG